jgi:hypothetical protein
MSKNLQHPQPVASLPQVRELLDSADWKLRQLRSMAKILESKMSESSEADPLDNADLGLYGSVISDFAESLMELVDRANTGIHFHLRSAEGGAR